VQVGGRGRAGCAAGRVRRGRVRGGAADRPRPRHQRESECGGVTAGRRPGHPVGDYLGDDPAGPATDPDNVPGTAVTGTATAGPGPSPYLAAVTVPTDAGRYVVLLSRTDGSAGWLVERFVLPEETGGP
jgi:hypothetical protein